MSLKALLRSPSTFLRHPRSTCTPRRTLLLALPSESDRRYRRYGNEESFSSGCSSLNVREIGSLSFFRSAMRARANTPHPNNKRNTLNMFLLLVFGIYLDPVGIIASLPNLKSVGQCTACTPRCRVRPFRSRTS